MTACFECGAPAEHDHHVVPKSIGGTRTVPLCGSCHSKVHKSSNLVTTSKLVRRALQTKKENGERIGTVMYGYSLGEDGKTLESNEREKYIIASVCTLRRQGWALRKIASLLDSVGLAPRSGLKWSAQTISQIAARYMDGFLGLTEKVFIDSPSWFYMGTGSRRRKSRVQRPTSRPVQSNLFNGTGFE